MAVFFGNCLFFVCENYYTSTNPFMWVIIIVAVIVTPYRRITKLMIALLVVVTVKWINAFPSKTFISGTIIPQEIIEVQRATYFIILTLNLRAYVQLYNVVTNNQRSRTIGLIELIPSNDKGGCWFI